VDIIEYILCSGFLSNLEAGLYWSEGFGCFLLKSWDNNVPYTEKRGPFILEKGEKPGSENVRYSAGR
jgi:hypothetical protein